MRFYSPNCRECGFSETRLPKLEIRERSLGLNPLSGQFSKQRPYRFRHLFRTIEVGHVSAGERL